MGLFVKFRRNCTYLFAVLKSDHGSGEWQLITTMLDDDDDVGWSLCLSVSGYRKTALHFLSEFSPTLRHCTRPT